MNKSLVLLVIAATSVQLAQAGLTDLFNKAKETVQQAQAMIQKPKEYQKGANPKDKQFTPISVEVKNKAGENIWVAVKTNGAAYKLRGKEVTKIPAGTTQPFEADISNPYQILVWTHEPASAAEAPTHEYNVPANETGYVTADPGGTLRQQTGPVKGLTKGTDTGNSLLKNVKQLVAA